MAKRDISGFTIAALLSLLAVTAFYFYRRASITAESVEKPPAAAVECYRHSFFTMGTVASFTFYTDSENAAGAAATAAKAEFAKISKLANLYDPASELSRLNRRAYREDFRCSELMWQILMRAKTAYIASNGEFDVTIKPLMVLWGFYRKEGKTPPSAAEIAAAKAKVGFDKLILDENKRTIRFSVEGMALDFGGIAKGLALDMAAQAVIAGGVKCGVLDLGGNLKFLPQVPPGQKAYTVAIRNPADPDSILERKLSLPGNSAVATSGDYERFVVLQGKRYGHIISPRTGYPVANPAVTVCTTSALDADICSTTLYLGGEAAVPRLRRTIAELQYYFTPIASN